MATKFWCFPFLCFLSPEDPSPPSGQPPSSSVELHPHDYHADPHPQVPSNVVEFPANDNRIDRGEASGGMVNKICCIPFPSSSSTTEDERDRPGDGHTEEFDEYISRPLKEIHDGDLDSFIESISQRLEWDKKKKSSSPEQFRNDWHWPSHSIRWEKLEKFLSVGMEYPNDLKSSMTHHVETLLEEIGHENFATAGLLIVAFLLERFRSVSTNKIEWSRLLKKMSGLARTVKDFEKGLESNTGSMEHIIKAATELIVEGYMTCCFEMKSSNFLKFFSTWTNKEMLRKFEENLDKTSNDINTSRRSPDAVTIPESGSSFVDVDLDGLLQYISTRLEQICPRLEQICPEPEVPTRPYLRFCHWLRSPEVWKKLKKFLSAGLTCICDVLKGVGNENVRSVLNEIGHASTVTAGLVAVAYVLDKVEAISENNEECMLVLKETFFLAKLLKRIAASPEGTPNLIEETKQLIIESAKTCCEQIDDNGYSKFWKTSINKSALDKIKERLGLEYQHINAQLGVRVLDALEYKKQPRLSRGYPENAVEIDDSSREVINLLDWGSERKATAVIVYGFGGLGKSTLADAVFSQINFDGCQYSMVDLSQNMDSNKIVELQKQILRDLMGTKNIPEFRKHEEGQRLLSSKLMEVPALIYIDNVSDKDKLLQLLPHNFDTAKKVRLLITARDINVGKTCRMKTPPKEYRMKCISSGAAKSFLLKQMPAAAKGLLANEVGEGKLNSKLHHIIDHMIERCGGIPLLLTSVAQELHFAKDTQKVFQIIEELDKMEGAEFGEKLESRLVYDNLPKQCKDPFLDICSFFQGWEWDTVGDIVGNSAIDELERRGLVLKDTDGVVTVHDVILRIGRRNTQGTRYRFTTASVLQKDDEKAEQIRYLKYTPANNFNQLMKMPSNLKYMEIDGKLSCNDLENFPMRLLRLGDLRILKLTNFEGLKELPSELANLVQRLRQLTLSNCKSLKKLPYSITKLKSLRVLKMDKCKSLKELPEDLVNLTSLVELDLSNCETLERLPKDLGSLHELRVLKLEHCESLKMLPHSFERLPSLKVLNLSYCKDLENLPEGLGNLTSLVKLDIKGCKKIISIPEKVGLLKSLSSMDISGCPLLKELPNGFCSLSITSLKLTKDISIDKLPEHFGTLKFLRVLKLNLSELQKLPASFSQLKHVVHLDLSRCSKLEELCEEFSGLSSLRTLSLEGCNNLKKLPTNFQSISSLQHLDLSNCQMLDGEWMDNVADPTSLEMVYIRNSAKLVERWGKQQGGLPFTVDAGQDLSKKEKENEWEKLSKFLTGKPFNVSSCPLNTIILVMFDGHSDFDHDFPWPLIEETVDDIKICFEMIYIGKHFNKLPRKLAHKIMARAVDNSDARLLFEKVFVTLQRNGADLWHQYMNKFFAMSAKIVDDGRGKYLSGWELLSKGKDFSKIEEFLQSKCGKYDVLKQLAKETQESNIHLLRELFVNVGEDNCLLGKSHEVGVDELKGKRIFIEIRLANESHDRIRLQSLTKMYSTRKDSADYEIISIPIGQLSTEFDQFYRDIPWLVVQNACRIRKVVKYFLSKECQREEGESERLESWYPSRVRIIEPNGQIAAYRPVLTMLERWGPEVYPFTDQIIEQLRNREWNEQKNRSSLEFLFKPMEELDKVKEVMHQGKMIWLLCDGKHPDTKRVRTKSFVQCIERALEDEMKNIHFIYVPHYDEENKQDIAVTDSIKMAYLPLALPEEELGLGPLLLPLPQWAAMRFWARVCYLAKEVETMGVDGEHWDGHKRLLESLNRGCLSMTLMNEAGIMLSTKGQDTMDIFDRSKSTPNYSPAEQQEAKRLIKQLIHEGRKETVDELESISEKKKKQWMNQKSIS